MKKILFNLIVMILILLTAACGCPHGTMLPADCTEPSRCSDCGEPSGMPLGHDWQAATCTEVRQCARCGKILGEAKGHDWKAADEENPETCRRCGETRGEALGAEQNTDTPLETAQNTLAEALKKYKPEFEYTDDILYVSITAPKGTAVKIANGDTAVLDKYVEVFLEAAASAEGIDCCIMLLNDLDETKVLLATYNDTIRYDVRD